jgi:phosphate transport system permease protein
VAEVTRPGLPVIPDDDDRPRAIKAPVAAGDRIFRGILRGSGFVVLGLTAAILVFLAVHAEPALKVAGWGFFTTSSWFSNGNAFGIAALLPFSVLIAVIALIIAIPVGIATALFISEYTPLRLRRILISVIDLMAAVPSIVVALFGLYYLMPRILGFDSWLSHHLSLIPVFSFRLPDEDSSYVGSTFVAAVVVSLLVIPVITSLSRQVFSQAPQGEREAAFALGSTRWGMIRTVVLPYGRAGMIGASMLGLGRALGETIAVSFILTPTYIFNYHVLEAGGNSVTYEIANSLLDDGTLGKAALLAAGLVLFVMTLGINTIAAIIINRSRSGASASAD